MNRRGLLALRQCFGCFPGFDNSVVVFTVVEELFSPTVDCLEPHTSKFENRRYLVREPSNLQSVTDMAGDESRHDAAGVAGQ